MGRYYILFMISFLKKEDEEKGGFLGKGDLIFLAVIAAIVGGFLYYSHTVEKKALALFSQCDQAWNAKDYSKSLTCYESRSDLSYMTDSLDSIAYKRIEVIQQMEESELALYRKLLLWKQQGQTDSLQQTLAKPQVFFLLDSAKRKEVQQLLP